MRELLPEVVDGKLVMPEKPVPEPKRFGNKYISNFGKNMAIDTFLRGEKEEEI